MQTSVESYTNHESMMLLCVTQPNALELVQKFMVQGLKEAVKEFSIADTSADVAALCAAAATAAAAGDSWAANDRSCTAEAAMLSAYKQRALCAIRTQQHAQVHGANQLTAQWPCALRW
jgi:hypothetical protein